EGFEIMDHSEYDLDLHEISGIWRNGSVVRSWLLELLHAAFERHGGKLEDIAPFVEDSGEGRWTILEAIDENVPAPVIAASLFALAFRRLLPERFAVLGVARSEETDDEFRERMKEAVKEHARDPFKEEIWDGLAEGMAYVATDFGDEGGEDEVARRLEELDEERKTGGNRV